VPVTVTEIFQYVVPSSPNLKLYFFKKWTYEVPFETKKILGHHKGVEIGHFENFDAPVK
jgi:DNA topoisomerase VI subunit B